MATSGSKSVAVTSWDTLKFSWTQVSQDVANNKTKISWVLQLIAGSSGRIDSSVSKDWSVTVNGTKYSGTNTIGISNNATKTLASGTTTITHNADGTKSFSYSFSQEFEITFSGSKIGTKSGSGTGTLNTIPRATTPTLSASSADMGASITINCPRASSAFTHDLAYSFAGGSYVSIATGVATSKAWTVADVASAIPNATSGTMTIRCITKNGSTTIGTKTVLLTVKVPASVVPTISAVSVEEAASGIAAQFGAFVQSKSKIKAAITAAGAKGSTIKSYSTTFNGKTYTGAGWTSAAVTSSGNLNLVTTVTDSRGRTAKKTTSIAVLAYTAPKIAAFSAVRCDATGAAKDDGTLALLSYIYAVASLGGKNTAEVVVEWKRSADSSYEDAPLWTTDELEGSGSVYTDAVNFSTDYQYDIRLSVVDWFGAKATYVVPLPSGAVILDLLADGTGISFFQTCERDGVTISGQLPRSAKALPAGTNLDTLLEPGFYVFSTETYATLVNTPLGGQASGSVEVIAEGEAGQVRQVITRCSVGAREYWERIYYLNAWQEDWRPVYKGGTDSRVLWSGVYYMTEPHTADLSEAISKQPKGIVLIFSTYNSMEDMDWNWQTFYVPKEAIDLSKGSGFTFMLGRSDFSFVGTKYLYIKDTAIKGHADNGTSGTAASGITYSNGKFVLRYVIGV